MTTFTFLRICFFLLLTGLVVQPAFSAPVPVKHNDVEYDITVKIDPVNRTIEGKSLITVDKPRELQLMLGAGYEVIQADFNDGPLGIGREQTNQPHIWNIPFLFRHQVQFLIRWKGVLAPLDTSLDHQQTLGRPVAVSGAAGTFLPDGSDWYPRVAGQLVRYKVSIELPSGQKGLVAGRLIEEQESPQNYQAVFQFSHPAEGIDLMAGPYAIETQTHQNINHKPIQLRTYFHPQISGLSKDYLDAVKRYLELYESSIGKYPYTEFSVVSSPTPTGFGMPTLTYLGTDVLQLPFIRNTSLGHEVLHNWWGNGVYPDYKSGNWSEGLTTFMADYAYKEQESDAAAHDMRLSWLRDFAALQPGQDAPLTAFTSRTHGASKIVGYNKAAMFFFMLRDHLGETIFQRGIQGLWKVQRFRTTSWLDVQKMFEMVSGQPLGPFFAQWLNRSGAPAIELAEVKNAVAGSGYELSITLKQSEPAYQLHVPVAVETQQGSAIHRLDVQQAQQTFTLKLTDKPLAVSLDPDLRLFRHLAPGEAPPILREVMVNAATQTVLLSEQPEVRKIAETLASKLQDRKLHTVAPGDPLSTAPTLVIGLQQEIDAWLAAKQLPARPDETGKKGSAQVWTLARADGASLAIISAQDAASLEALIRPLPHYGRQSYLVFDGRQAIEKGTWPMQVQKVVVE
ncbi:MAG: M1 family peptidase [Nitrosomonas sp.]|uniref:M1 family metallopeptidase n=1 Tax=Nitrosomonas sp. TaxID=42353 RepID=UPI0025FBA7D6|nr:M1 family aminopeptidase [Nitrosomonas sp.]UJP04075.1 MAG: M1 family peptidase [Nitrosomonas sp.]